MGKLILVATPIGNLEDISGRQQVALQAADLVAAEDTRHSGLLLQHIGLKKPLLSYYQHNEEKREERLLAELDAGHTVALISDAGTPGICDPGAAILRAAVQAGHETDAIPGPCALIQALILSGLPTERFAFEGFLPRGQALLPFLQSLRQERRTLIFYEAPHRLQNTLQVMLQAFEPERPLAVCRELTKKFQEVNRGTLAEMAELWQQRTPRGEFVLVLGGQSAEATPPDEEIRENARQQLARLLAGGMKHKAAAKEVAAVYNLPISEVYQMGLDLKTVSQ